MDFIMTTFNAANFTLPSITQELIGELKMHVKPLRFGLFSDVKGQPAKEVTTIAFGHMLDSGVKHRLGSITIEDDYILVLSMDSTEEYRACDKWDCIYFLNALAASTGYDWVEAEKNVPARLTK